MLSTSCQTKRTIIAALLAVGSTYSLVQGALAQVATPPQGITQATALTFKNVKSFCQATVDYAKRQSAEPGTVLQVKNLEDKLQLWNTYKVDYKSTGASKSNLQAVQDMRVASAYETILEIDNIVLQLASNQHFGDVFLSYDRCLQEVERLKKYKISFNQAELDQVLAPYHLLMQSYSVAKQVREDYRQMFDHYLQQEPAPAGASSSQVDDAELNAALKAVRALLTQN